MNDWWLLASFFVLSLIALVIAIYPLRQIKFIKIVLTPIMAILVALAYWTWGAWPDWKDYQKQQAKQQQIQAMLKSIRSPQELIDKLKARVMQEPDSARGWYLLGRLYASQDRWQEAADSYAKAHELQADDLKITVSYAQSLWQINHRQFDDTSRALLQSVLQKNKDQPDALAMLAMDAFLGHSYQQAINYWQRLLELAPPQSEDAQAIRKAIAKAEKKISSRENKNE